MAVPGASCSADYFTGAPRDELCNATGDGWGGACRIESIPERSKAVRIELIPYRS